MTSWNYEKMHQRAAAREENRRAAVHLTDEQRAGDFQGIVAEGINARVVVAAVPDLSYILMIKRANDGAFQRSGNYKSREELLAGMFAKRNFRPDFDFLSDVRELPQSPESPPLSAK